MKNNQLKILESPNDNKFIDNILFRNTQEKQILSISFENLNLRLKSEDFGIEHKLAGNHKGKIVIDF